MKLPGAVEFRGPRAVVTAAAVLVAVALPLAACGSSGTSSSSSAASPVAGGSPQSSSAGAMGSGPVNVLYAGSLVDLMQSQIGPGLKKASGYDVEGFAAGSNALATQIKGKVHQGDVFISANPKVNTTLQGAKNGNWVSWYATYSSSPVVIGFDPKSKFAKELRTKPWYDVVTEPGFRLGRTDPVNDPKGKLAKQALTSQAKKTPALSKLASSDAGIYPEETLIGRLQSGQLDAGFFYNSEAVAAKIPTVPLTGQALKAVYTVTVLNRAPHPSAAIAFVKYLLGPKGAADLKKDGYNLVAPPKATGSGMPAVLKSVISGS
ncbi:substrate-binding domain-containing protein [Leekyejoonella antrihumi]|uniref:Extracellular solute-binding protein n=1 Tax=Leekyejoonella antrihumi TaxID=1660198 RepID=A0A563DZ87_9MICO|nr:substrate-binding domain-containing protein [Leekyejoonella antrihumi]TWP34964.1 extracellular solute-binding protein [Leekyejoonella antrihumi]